MLKFTWTYLGHEHRKSHHAACTPGILNNGPHFLVDSRKSTNSAFQILPIQQQEIDSAWYLKLDSVIQLGNSPGLKFATAWLSAHVNS